MAVLGIIGFVVFIVGIISLVSASKKQKPKKKPIITLIVGLVIVLGCMGADPSTPASTASSVSSVPVNSSLPSSVESSSEESSTLESSSEPVSSEEVDLAQILADDDEISLNVLKSEKITDILTESIVSFSNQEITSLELYNLAKTAKENQSTFSLNLEKLRNDNNKAYVEACELYVYNGHEFANNLMKYLDKNEMKYLSEAQSCMEKKDTYVLSVVKERISYLSNNGISDEEISEILQKTSPVDEALANS